MFAVLQGPANLTVKAASRSPDGLTAPLQVYWGNCRRWFEATVSKYLANKGDEQFQVDYDDGETERGVLGTGLFRTRKKDFQYNLLEVDTSRAAADLGTTEQSKSQQGGKSLSPQKDQQLQPTTKRDAELLAKATEDPTVQDCSSAELSTTPSSDAQQQPEAEADIGPAEVGVKAPAKDAIQSAEPAQDVLEPDSVTTPAIGNTLTNATEAVGFEAVKAALYPAPVETTRMTETQALQSLTVLCRGWPYRFLNTLCC